MFLLNAGDIFIRHRHRWPEPEPEHYLRRARSMIQTMNDLGYDVMTAGNHELHYTEDFTRQALEFAEFPILAANIRIDTDRLPKMKPYTILETDTRYTLAILGLSVVNFQAEGVAATDPIETARDYLHLTGENDLFIGLTHLGVSTERRLAREVPEFDVIVGGHSHALLNPAENIGGVLVAQAGGVPRGHPVHESLHKYLGKVVITLENGRVVEKSGTVETFE